MRPAPTLAVALVLVLGGCSGLLGDAGEGPEDRRSTITPASVPAEFDHPPGVNPTRITLDPDALVSAHGQLVHQGNVAVRMETRRQRLPNGSVRSSRQHTVLTDDRAVFYTFSNATVGYADGTWSNGTHTVRYVRGSDFTATNVSTRPSVPGPSVDIVYRNRLRAWLNNSGLQAIERVDTGAGVSYRITATINESGVLWREDVWTNSNVTNGTLVAVVSPDGLITTMQVEYTVVTSRGRYRIEHRLAVRPGIDRLPRPDWVDRTLANHSGA